MNNPLSSSEQVKKQSVCEVCVWWVGGCVRAGRAQKVADVVDFPDTTTVATSPRLERNEPT